MKPKLTISKYGTKYRKLNGKRYRTDGPAVIHPNGTKCWYLNGELHRIDGPAIIYPNGSKYWYLNGNYCTQKTWFNTIIKRNLK